MQKSVRFPWADPSSACVVVARAPWLPPASTADRPGIEQAYETAAERARRALAKRWIDVESIVVDDAAATAILDAIKRFNATTAVLGWRGHRKFRRLLAGSVARTVAARAPCPALIVRASAQTLRQFVIGYDGSANAERAIEFVAALQAPLRQQIHVLNAHPVVSETFDKATLIAERR